MITVGRLSLDYVSLKYLLLRGPGLLLFHFIFSIFFSFAAFQVSANDTSSNYSPLNIEMRLSNQADPTVQVTHITPGDRHTYHLDYTNKIDTPLYNVIANLPIPEAMKLEKPCCIETLEGSVDGERYTTWPFTTTVLSKDGKPIKKPIPLSEIRHLRWSIKQISPQEKKSFFAEIVVLNE